MNTIKKSIRTSFLLLFAAAAITACKKDDDMVPVPPPVENEGEIITTMTLILTDSAGIEPEVTATFRDPDGEGGSGPDIRDTIQLVKGTTYNASIEVLNETESPAEDLTHEIEDEDHEHLFCFTVSGADIAIERTDSDGTYEVGLQSKWTTGSTSNGTVRVELKHQPDVKDGTCSVGETDIDVTYVTEIQ